MNQNKVRKLIKELEKGLRDLSAQIKEALGESD